MPRLSREGLVEKVEENGNRGLDPRSARGGPLYGHGVPARAAS